MSGRSVYITTLFLGKSFHSEAGYQYIVFIFSPLTDKYFSLISRRERMAVELFLWPNLQEKMMMMTMMMIMMMIDDDDDDDDDH